MKRPFCHFYSFLPVSRGTLSQSVAVLRRSLSGFLIARRVETLKPS
jgi:hypothetical protein